MLVIRFVGPDSTTFSSLFVDFSVSIFIDASPIIIVYKLIICSQINKQSTDPTILDNLLKIKLHIILIFICQNISEYNITQVQYNIYLHYNMI